MENSRRRLWISSKDIEIIAERSPRHARRLLQRIRRKLAKDKWQPVSIAEFCQYMGIDTEAAYQRLEAPVSLKKIIHL